MSPEDTTIAETMLRIRPGERRDVPAVVAMIGALAAHHGDTATVTASDLERDLFTVRPWADLLVAEIDGTLVGYTMLWRLFRAVDGQRALEMDHLYVTAERRGLGIGRRIVERVVAHARELGCVRIGVGTAPGNTRAQAFYRGLGFEPATPGPRFRLVLPESR